MAGSVNKVILVGNLGKDPEVRTMQNGGRVASFSIATSETWKDKATGERKERTEWHRIAVYNDQLIGVVERFLKKGSKVYLEGALETRKWTDQSGQEKYTTEIVLKQYRGELTMLDGPSGGRGEGASGGYEPDYAGGRDSMGGGNRGGGQEYAPSRSAPISDLDDEIPF